jgi:SAM-dependent methyltransferase
MHLISTCPICSGDKFKEYGEAKDYTVSHETFKLMKCNGCEFLITSPRPTNDKLGEYYISPSYVSHTTKAKTFFDKVYTATREFALNWKLTLVKKFLTTAIDTARILDYGCGTGFFLQKLQKNGFNIAGVEPSQLARTNAEKITNSIISPSLLEVSGTFDTITLWHVLEHVADLNETVEQLKSKLSAEGTIFIAVPNYKSNDARFYKMDWAGYDVPRHLWHFEQKTMKQLLSKHDLQLIATVPMKLDALYVSMLSEKYLAGKQTVGTFLSGLMTGLKSNAKATDNNYSSIIYIARHA